MSKIEYIISVTIIQYMRLCVFSLPISLMVIERIYESMNYYPLFRVTSWNNDMRCMPLYIIIVWYMTWCNECNIIRYDRYYRVGLSMTERVVCIYYDIWYDVICYMIWYRIWYMLYDMKHCDMMWCDVMRRDVLWRDVAWHDMIW